MTYTTPDNQTEHFSLFQTPINPQQCGFIPTTSTSTTYFVPLSTNIDASISLNAINNNGIWTYYLVVFDVIDNAPSVLQLPCKLNLLEKLYVHYYMYRINRAYKQGRGQIVKAR